MSRAADNTLQRSTMLIRCLTPLGESRGTGFMFSFESDDGYATPLLITNKHVVNGATEIRLKITLSDTSDNNKPIGIADYCFSKGWEHLWIPHPDPDVDLGGLSIASMLSDLESRGLGGYGNMFSVKEIITQDERSKLSVVEDIQMIGYPTGLSDTKHNLPLTRRGITASDPSVPYEGRRETLIDCACFPGSSGSPVVLKGGVSVDSKDGNLVMTKRASKLIGILYAGPVHVASGEIRIRNVPTSQIPYSETKMMINLGYIIHADRILELEDLVPNGAEGRVDFSLKVTDFEGRPLRQ